MQNIHHFQFLFFLFWAYVMVASCAKEKCFEQIALTVYRCVYVCWAASIKVNKRGTKRCKMWIDNKRLGATSRIKPRHVIKLPLLHLASFFPLFKRIPYERWIWKKKIMLLSNVPCVHERTFHSIHSAISSIYSEYCLWHI